MKSLSHMCRTRFFGVIVLAAPLLSMAVAFADSLDQRIDALEAAFLIETAEKEKKIPDEERRMRSYDGRNVGASFISQLRALAERGDFRQIDEQLNQSAAYFQSEAARKAFAKIREQVKIDQAAREKAFSEKIAVALKLAEKSVKTAAKPADLDEALEKLSDLNDRSNYQVRENFQDQINRLSAVRQFVINWQDFLVADASGDKDRARSSLQNASSNENAGLLPRSEILARMEKVSGKKGGPRTLAEIVGGEISLERIPSVLDALRNIRASSDSRGIVNEDSNAASALQTELSNLSSTYDQYLAGLPSKFTIRGNSYGNDTQGQILKYTLPAKTELLRIVLPEYLGSADKMANDETVQVYLDRILARASADLDTETISKVIDLQTALQSSAGTRGNALQILIVARNQEEAGQFSLAVLSYQNALKSGDSIIPAKAVGARLDAIKDAHPEDYRVGTEKALSGGNAEVGGLYRSSSEGSIIIPGSVDAQPRK